MPLNHYQILEINAHANNSEIKKAFRRLALQYHPDKSNGDDISQEYYLQIQEAYQTLLDPIKRKIYDQELWLNSAPPIKNSKGSTPESLLKRLSEMHSVLLQQKVMRIAFGDLFYWLEDSLNDAYVAVMKIKGNKVQQVAYAEYLILLSEALPAPFRNIIHERIMHQFGKHHVEIEEVILAHKKSHHWNDWFHHNKFWLILLIAIVLCALMYFYSK